MLHYGFPSQESALSSVLNVGVRDYIHVEDLAMGHIAALKKLFSSNEGICMVHNLGTGKGVSVLELAKYFEQASGKEIPLNFTAR